MTLAEFATILRTSGYPVAYLAFPANQAPKMPFITYQETGSNNFGGDGKVYKKVRRLQVDLFTAEKDITAEEKLETALDQFFWNKNQSVEETENCQRYTYEVEVIGG